MRMPHAAKPQKLVTAGRLDVAPNAKASMSVSEVMVMLTPTCPMACATLYSTLCFLSVLSNPCTMTNISSTPMPTRMKGSTLVTGLKNSPVPLLTPKEAKIDTITAMTPHSANTHRHRTGWKSPSTMTAYIMIAPNPRLRMMRSGPMAVPSASLIARELWNSILMKSLLKDLISLAHFSSSSI